MSALAAQLEDSDCVVSFVVIGYNEGMHLRACFESIRAADLAGIASELIYVDGGSTDDSLAVARACGVDQTLGGERRRRAAENRNLGLAHARGRFVQFVDGDMQLDPAWPRAAIDLLEQELETLAVWGLLREKNQGLLYRALQLDWEFVEGPTRYCGGAAMFRRQELAGLGGFPEDVRYGEEPYLCWRIRNELGRTVYHLHRPMADHDLAYKGFLDYCRRNVRVGMTYAEIANRCKDSSDPLWSAEVRSISLWSILLAGMLFVLIAGPGATRLAALVALAVLVARKTWQKWRQGHPIDVSVLYAGHTYFAKLCMGYGVARWGGGKLVG